MNYWIDGYNLLFRFSESGGNLRRQREEIVSFLQDEFARFRLRGLLFFDGAHVRGSEGGRSYQSPLEIFYTSYGETADQAMLERLEGCKEKSSITLVTDDRFLSEQARKLGAHSLQLKAFLLKLKAYQKKKKAHQESKKEGRVIQSKKDLDRLLEIFEKRLIEER